MAVVINHHTVGIGSGAPTHSPTASRATNGAVGLPFYLQCVDTNLTGNDVVRRTPTDRRQFYTRGSIRIVKYCFNDPRAAAPVFTAVSRRHKIIKHHNIMFYYNTTGTLFVIVYTIIGIIFVSKFLYFLLYCYDIRNLNLNLIFNYGYMPSANQLFVIYKIHCIINV